MKMKTTKDYIKYKNNLEAIQKFVGDNYKVVAIVAGIVIRDKNEFGNLVLKQGDRLTINDKGKPVKVK